MCGTALADQSLFVPDPVSQWRRQKSGGYIRSDNLSAIADPLILVVPLYGKTMSRQTKCCKEYKCDGEFCRSCPLQRGKKAAIKKLIADEKEAAKNANMSFIVRNKKKYDSRG